MLDVETLALDAKTSALGATRQCRQSREVFGDIGDLGVDVTPQMCNPSGICLPGTDLLQSPFRTELSMGSRSRRYRRSLWRHRRFLRSYRRSLRRCRDPWGDRRSPIVAWLAKHHKTLLNILKHHETHVKHRELLVKHHETLKTLWNILKHSSFDATIPALDAKTLALDVDSAFRAATSAIAWRSFDATISALDAEASARRRQRYCRGVSGDIGYCGVGITPQMCNRVTNHGDMSNFSKPDV